MKLRMPFVARRYIDFKQVCSAVCRCPVARRNRGPLI
jgi:hypothetical protein